MNNVGHFAGGYGIECDYWSLGIMVYEMVYGKTPFGAETMTTTYGNIMNFKSSFKFPSKEVSPEFTSLISGLVSSAETRLGYQKLIHHPFFASIDWNALREKSPPYVPVITGLDDTSNFDEFDNDYVKPHSTINLKNTQLGSGRNLPFIGFTHIKEGSLVSQAEQPPSLIEYKKRIGELESELNCKTKEISELRKLKIQHEHESKQWNRDLLDQKIVRLEQQRDTLEKQLARAQRDADNNRRILDLEQSQRKENEVRVVEMVAEMKKNWEKIVKKKENEMENQIQVI